MTEDSTDDGAGSPRVRPYDPDRDADDLRALKRAFEMGLATDTGGEDKPAKYEAKLTDEYAERYLDWVLWCTKHERRCVTVVEADAETADGEPGDAATDDPALAGYAFVLPQQLSMIWDAAVLNELYLRPEYRGTGVADDLMAAVVALAEDQDLPMDRLVLDVDQENDRAQAFYDRHGFEQWAEMVARELDGE
ncbi:GNAT family N-acetyltransferase [Halorussus halobius]|uniref:GNAT family N-acetyltransferase n=1 Tax=Halorussus halobius TaxID=1710537 RepID=UPI001092FD85|nr:N-acetyltransferase [Halorussus halobius]